MNRDFRIVIFFVFCFIFYSCTSYKGKIFKEENGIEQARLNVIKDFVHSYKMPKDYLLKRHGKPFDVFWIFEKNIQNEVYLLSVSPEIDDGITLNVLDSLGKIPYSNFPNRYMIEKGNLFVWRDSVTPLQKDILNIMHEFNILDSVDVKRELNLLPKDFEDNRMLTLDHTLKSVHYYVCKNNVFKYKKIRTNKAYGYYSAPKLNCSK